MTRSIFGWDYPPGCSSTPYDYDEAPQPRCEACQAFLSYEPDNSYRREFLVTDYGPSVPEGCTLVKEIDAPDFDDATTWYEYTRPDFETVHETKCRKCSHINKWSEY